MENNERIKMLIAAGNHRIRPGVVAIVCLLSIGFDVGLSCTAGTAATSLRHPMRLSVPQTNNDFIPWSLSSNHPLQLHETTAATFLTHLPHRASANPRSPPATMSNHQRTSRPKPPPPGNERAEAELNLGEFQGVDTLTLSEAALVLNALVAKRRNDRKNVNETEMLNTTLNYLDHFARFTQKENVEAVERLLSAQGNLEKFERAQLGTSLPAEEMEREPQRVLTRLQGAYAVKVRMRPRR